MSFLKRSWASPTGSLARAISTVHRGVAFEERALRLLKDNFSMSLRRVGGRGDGGIDLIGWWWLPRAPLTGTEPGHDSPHQDLARRRRFRVVGQCKAEKKKMGPNYVRELEGVMYRLTASARLYGDRAPPLVEADATGSRTPAAKSATNASADDRLSEEEKTNNEEDILLADDPMVAILVSQSPFTKATLLRAKSSPIPFLLLHLPPRESTLDPSRMQALDVDRGANSSPSLPAPGTGQANASTSTSISTSASGSPDSCPVAAAVWNMALGGTQGLLQGQMEVRWERDLTGGMDDRPGLWWMGKKVENCIPEGG
ncbi:hypothetical protein H1R20_g273, partial [Candolleomyces eurysporus]